MKKLVLLFTSVLLLAAQPALAYDFSAVAPSGQTLYFNIINSSEVAVTFPGNDPTPSNPYVNHYQGYAKPTGVLTIPSTVNYNENTYNVTHIWSDAFENCTGLLSVTIPSSVISIESRAFYNCTGLLSVTIPDSVINIGFRAFYNVGHIEYHGNASGAPWGALLMNGADNGFIYTDSTKQNLYLYVGTSEDVVIPPTVDTISQYAFFNRSEMISLTIPNSVTYIGKYAFSGCSSLTTVNFNADSCTYMGTYSYPVFDNCTNLATVNIGNNVIVIPSSAFKNCSGLTSVAIPNSVTYIGNYAFQGCSSLESVVIPNSVTYIREGVFRDCTGLMSVSIPNSVTAIGYYAFYNCSGLTSVMIPNSVTNIWGSAFFSCSSLESVVIPNSVTSISGAVFLNCTGLASVTIGNSVTTIGVNAFTDCTSLTSVTLLSETAPTLEGNPFMNNSSLRFYIPCGAWNSYNSDDSWSRYRCYLREPQAEGVSINIEVNDRNIGYATASYRPDNVSIVYCDSTVIIEALAIDSGYHFGYWNNGRTSNPDTIYLIGDSILKAFFVPNYCTINMLSDNEAFGTIYGDGTFEYGTTVSIIANAIDHHHFTHWNDGNTDNPRTFVLTQDTSFTAFFEKNSYSITTTSENTVRGIATCSSSTALYLDSITISAIPNYGYHFTSWSDGNTDNPRTITLTQDTSLTAFFSKNIYTVAVNSGNTTRGNVYGSGNIEYLDTIELLATPNYGYHFTQWNDGNTDNPRNCVVTRDSSFTAQFDFNQYEIIVNIDSSIHGTTSGAGIFNYLTPATISASANYGYHFTSWSDGNTDNPRTISLTQDTSFTAYFEKNSYAVTVLSNNNTMGQAAGGDTVLYLDSITISASANYGYHFTYWQDNNTDNPRTVQVTQNKTYTAFFDYNQYTISLGVDTTIHGTTSGAGIFNYLTPTTISASANYGYHFTSWSDGNTDNPRTISLTQDTSFTAYFEKNSYAVTVLSNNDTMGQAAGGDTVLYLDSITISASANYGYHFTHWQDNNTDNPRTVQVTQNKTYTAYFDYDQFTLTVQSDNTTQGNVSGSGNYNYLSNRTITATPTYGHHFTYWNDGVTENPRTITLTQDTSFTAHFALNQYTLTVSAGEHGTATGSGTYNFGDTISIQATPDDHYHFTRWNDGNRENPRYIRIEEDITLTAFFAIDTHTVSVTTSDIVRGQVEASGTEFVYGTPCTVTATAYTGYVFAGWSNGVTANPYTFAVVSDVELTAIFDSVTVGITDIDANDVSIHVAGGRILVMGAEGMEMRVFDIVGREVVSPTQSGESPVLPRGVYLVKVGTLPAKKVVVM